MDDKFLLNPQDSELLQIKAQLGELFMWKQKLEKEINSLTEIYEKIQADRDQMIGTAKKGGRDVKDLTPEPIDKFMYASQEQLDELFARISIDEDVQGKALTPTDLVGED